MERLTQNGFDMCLTCGAGRTCEHFCNRSFPECGEKVIYNRLTAYEDTGLEPEDVRRLQQDWTSLIMALDEMGGMPHLHELAQAEKDGRLVVLGTYTEE